MRARFIEEGTSLELSFIIKNNIQTCNYVRAITQSWTAYQIGTTMEVNQCGQAFTILKMRIGVFQDFLQDSRLKTLEQKPLNNAGEELIV